MSPYAVANKSYVVNDRLAWESQLVHAVIEQRAPIEGRLRHTFKGEGVRRKCIVTAKVRGESEPFVYESPEIGTITPKNSPLWKTKPDLQLFYNASRDWARMHFPDLLMGVDAEDEMTVEPAEPVTTQVLESTPMSRAEHLRRQVNERMPADPVATSEAAAKALGRSTLWGAPVLTEVEREPEPEPAQAEPEPTSIHPPAVPNELADYAKDIHKATTAAQIEEAFQKHVNTQGQLSLDEYEAGVALRDWKFDAIGATQHKLKDNPSDGTLFENSPSYE
jgi:hypothetical protein